MYTQAHFSLVPEPSSSFRLLAIRTVSDGKLEESLEPSLSTLCSLHSQTHWLTSTAKSEFKSDKKVSHVTIIMLIHRPFSANDQYVTSDQHQRTNMEVEIVFSVTPKSCLSLSNQVWLP